jgi:hypothetical protein
MRRAERSAHPPLPRRGRASEHPTRGAPALVMLSAQSGGAKVMPKNRITPETRRAIEVIRARADQRVAGPSSHHRGATGERRDKPAKHRQGAQRTPHPHRGRRSLASHASATVVGAVGGVDHTEHQPLPRRGRAGDRARRPRSGSRRQMPPWAARAGSRRRMMFRVLRAPCCTELPGRDGRPWRARQSS